MDSNATMSNFIDVLAGVQAALIHGAWTNELLMLINTDDTGDI